MNDIANRRVILTSHPVGFPQITDFELIESLSLIHI